MKWQLYNKEPYSEVYFQGDTPRSFSEWETIKQAISSRECIYWLSPDAFIMFAGFGMGWLSSATREKRNFPQCFFEISTTTKLMNIYATTQMEAFRTLYEMTQYHDFASSFRKIWHRNGRSNIMLPTMLLKGILEEATYPLSFWNITFPSAFAGRVLAQSGRDTHITLGECEFVPAAEEAFVDGMLSKTDKNSGLTGLFFLNSLPILDQSLIRLMMSGNGPIAFSFQSFDTPYSEEVLDCLRTSFSLQSLQLSNENFTSLHSYASFVSSLNSTSLRSLAIKTWDMRDLAFPVEIFENLALTHFCINDVYFHEVSWQNLLQGISKCRTLNSLEFKYIVWWGSEDEDLAAIEFARELAQFLKDNPNILATNTESYFEDRNDDTDEILYTTHLEPILEYNRLTKNLKTLKERENYEVRGFLVSEALGARYASKVSSCYRILKENVDVLVSFLSSDTLGSHSGGQSS